MTSGQFRTFAMFLLSESTMCTILALAEALMSIEIWWREGYLERSTLLLLMDAFPVGNCKIFACRTNSFVQSFFVLILEQCTSRSLHQKERKFGRFSRILLEDSGCVFRAIPIQICILPQHDVHSHENHWEKKTAWIWDVEKKRMNWEHGCCFMEIANSKGSAIKHLRKIFLNYNKCYFYGKFCLRT